MAKTPRGTHRVKRDGGLPDAVAVTDGTMTFEIPEDRYVEKDYQPPLDKLPWQGHE